MPAVEDAPQVTVTDPSVPLHPEEPVDLLSSGGTGSRLPRRVVVVGLALVLLVAGTLVGLDRYRAHQDGVRREAAAFAAADTVHVRIAVREAGVYAEPPLDVLDDPSAPGLPALPPLGRLVVPLVVTDDAAALTEVREVEVTGDGIVAAVDLTQLAARLPGGTASLDVVVDFSCSEVAAGHYPTVRSAVVLVVPESGREHRLSVPLTAPPERAREACLLPDPDAVPQARAEEQHGRLFLFVDGVPRSRLPLRVLSLTSPGFALRLSDGPPGRPPGIVPPGVGVGFDVSIRVTDCAAARAGSGTLTLAVREGSRRWTLVVPDGPVSDFSRPGSARLLRAVEQACP